MAMAYNSLGKISSPSETALVPNIVSGSEEKPSQSFGDILTQKSKQWIADLEHQGKTAEALTRGAASGSISELDHIMGLKNFERSLSLGTETFKKLIEAYKDIGRMLG